MKIRTDKLNTYRYIQLIIIGRAIFSDAGQPVYILTEMFVSINAPHDSILDAQNNY